MSKSEYRKNASDNHSSLIDMIGNIPRIESLVIVLIIILAIWYSYHRLTKTLQFSPQALYEKTFVEPLESIKDLSGTSKATVGFDSWIRFNCPTGANLRNAKEFKPYIAEVGRVWFAEKYADDRVLCQPINNYEYFVRSENNVGNIVNEALLINKSTHDYFYRTWGL